jgi:deoxycytidylate deaminase
MIISAGIAKIIYEKGYPDYLAERMLKESKITIQQYHPPG